MITHCILFIVCLKCSHFFTLVLWWYEVWFTFTFKHLYILLSHTWGGSSVHSTFNVPTKLNIIEDLLTSKNNQTWSDVTKINWNSDPVTKCYKTVSDVLVCWWCWAGVPWHCLMVVWRIQAQLQLQFTHADPGHWSQPEYGVNIRRSSPCL